MRLEFITVKCRKITFILLGYFKSLKMIICEKNEFNRCQKMRWCVSSWLSCSAPHQSLRRTIEQRASPRLCSLCCRLNRRQIPSVSVFFLKPSSSPFSLLGLTGRFSRHGGTTFPLILEKFIFPSYPTLFYVKTIDLSKLVVDELSQLFNVLRILQSIENRVVISKLPLSIHFWIGASLYNYYSFIYHYI